MFWDRWYYVHNHLLFYGHLPLKKFQDGPSVAKMRLFYIRHHTLIWIVTDSLPYTNNMLHISKWYWLLLAIIRKQLPCGSIYTHWIWTHWMSFTTPLKYIENEAPPLRTICNLVSSMVGFSRVTGLIFIHPMGIIPFHQWGTTQWVQGDRESRMAYVSYYC